MIATMHVHQKGAKSASNTFLNKTTKPTTAKLNADFADFAILLAIKQCNIASTAKMESRLV